ncbi:hypothetical protein [Streptomyces niveus]|uniref:hypothetical protein n=1 Tax=Streptomyces niveus TaxID=193462 RepID=UPI0036D2415E
MLTWLHAVDDGTETPQHSEESDRTGIEAYGKLLDFRYATSDAVAPEIPGLTDE